MLRNATIHDVPVMLDIYRPYILDTAITFEYEVPSLEEFTTRFHTVTARFPWLVWEEDGVVTSANEASCRFHEALGYRPIATFERTGVKFGRWYGITWYEKRIREGVPEHAPTTPFEQE